MGALCIAYVLHFYVRWLARHTHKMGIKKYMFDGLLQLQHFNAHRR